MAIVYGWVENSQSDSVFWEHVLHLVVSEGDQLELSRLIRNSLHEIVFRNLHFSFLIFSPLIITLNYLNILVPTITS